MFDYNFKDIRSLYRQMYCEYVQCFQLMLIKPLMTANTGRNMYSNLCIHNKLVISEGIYILYT
jgi:hypothetical protein